MGVLKLEEYWEEAWINYCGEPNLKGKFNDLEYDENQLRYIVIGEFPTPDELESSVGYMHDENVKNIRVFVKSVLSEQDFHKECYAEYKTYLSAVNGDETKAICKEIDHDNWYYMTYLESPSTPLKKATYQEAKWIEEFEVNRKSLDKSLDRLLMTDLDYTYSTLKANDKYVKSLNNSIRRYEYDID